MHYDNFFYIGDLKTYDNQILLRYEIFLKSIIFYACILLWRNLKWKKLTFHQ